jgi:type II secretory ATPase GspE/PulE/Tfp pilus assembly ATPase PilB-like protein
MSGYSGREMVYELLRVTPDVADAIEQGASPRAIAKIGIKRANTIMANALRHVASGAVDMASVRRLDSVDSVTSASDGRAPE